MADCKHKLDFMLCDGAEYCTFKHTLNIDIAECRMKGKAYSKMAKAVKDGKLESYHTYEELYNVSHKYNERAKFLKKNYEIIQVFCIGGME